MSVGPRIIVLISGSGTNLQALIDASKTNWLGGEIDRVISNRANALGLERARAAGIRSEVLSYGPFKTEADPRIAYDKALVGAVNASAPDLVVLAGFMRILTPTFLQHVVAPVMNLHPALPGCYSGIQAMERAWTDFEAQRISQSGVMVHEVIEEVDMGPVIDTRVLPMTGLSCFEEFKSKMHKLEHELLVDVVRNWCLRYKSQS